MQAIWDPAIWSWFAPSFPLFKAIQSIFTRILLPPPEESLKLHQVICLIISLYEAKTDLPQIAH